MAFDEDPDSIVQPDCIFKFLIQIFLYSAKGTPRNLSVTPNYIQIPPFILQLPHVFPLVLWPGFWHH